MCVNYLNDTSTSLIHSHLMKYPVLCKKMSGGSESLRLSVFRCNRERSIVECLIWRSNAAVDSVDDTSIQSLLFPSPIKVPS